MIGVKEIFAIILAKLPAFKEDGILKSPAGYNKHPNGISLADYKKILDT